MSKLIAFKIHKTTKYTTLSLAAVEDKRLSWKSKGLHLYLLSRPESWEVRFTDLLRRSTDGHSSLMSSVKELVKYGYLKVTRVREEKGKFIGSIWEVFEEPQVSKNSSKEPDNTGVSPYVQNPHMVFPHVDNGSISNKHISNTKLSQVVEFDKAIEKIESELIK